MMVIIIIEENMQRVVSDLCAFLPFLATERNVQCYYLLKCEEEDTSLSLFIHISLKEVFIVCKYSCSSLRYSVMLSWVVPLLISSFVYIQSVSCGSSSAAVAHKRKY
jgi:hypothetical protein